MFDFLYDFYKIVFILKIYMCCNLFTFVKYKTSLRLRDKKVSTYLLIYAKDITQLLSTVLK